METIKECCANCKHLSCITQNGWQGMNNGMSVPAFEVMCSECGYLDRHEGSHLFSGFDVFGQLHDRCCCHFEENEDGSNMYDYIFDANGDKIDIASFFHAKLSYETSALLLEYESKHSLKGLDLPITNNEDRQLVNPALYFGPRCIHRIRILDFIAEFPILKSEIPQGTLASYLSYDSDIFRW